MIDTVFLGPSLGEVRNFLLTVGSFFNKKEHSEADWLVPLLFSQLVRILCSLCYVDATIE